MELPPAILLTILQSTDLNVIEMKEDAIMVSDSLSGIGRFKKELTELIKQGQDLGISLAIQNTDDTSEIPDGIDVESLPDFKSNYEEWYSKSMQIIRLLLPDRIDDFLRYYRVGKRKEIDALNYGIEDYMLGVEINRPLKGVIADVRSAIPKFMQQFYILRAAKSRLESSLFDMREILQADLFDSDLDAADELLSKGFLRGAGAIAGVVLEKYLKQVCQKFNLSVRKKHPVINDFNQKLKDNNIIDTHNWRYIQHLADLRNLCDHKKVRDPSHDDVDALIEGVKRIIKLI